MKESPVGGYASHESPEKHKKNQSQYGGWYDKSLCTPQHEVNSCNQSLYENYSNTSKSINLQTENTPEKKMSKKFIMHRRSPEKSTKVIDFRNEFDSQDEQQSMDIHVVNLNKTSIY